MNILISIDKAKRRNIYGYKIYVFDSLRVDVGVGSFYHFRLTETDFSIASFLSPHKTSVIQRSLTILIFFGYIINYRVVRQSSDKLSSKNNNIREKNSIYFKRLFFFPHCSYVHLFKYFTNNYYR